MLLFYAKFGINEGIDDEEVIKTSRSPELYRIYRNEEFSTSSAMESTVKIETECI